MLHKTLTPTAAALALLVGSSLSLSSVSMAASPSKSPNLGWSADLGKWPAGATRGKSAWGKEQGKKSGMTGSLLIRKLPAKTGFDVD